MADTTLISPRPYVMPLCTIGGCLLDKARGPVRVFGITDAPVQWPFTRPRGRGPISLILCGDLVRAVESESVAAVSRAWNVSRSRVQRWRRELGVPTWNDGTLALCRRELPRRITPAEGRAGGLASRGTPKRRRPA